MHPAYQTAEERNLALKKTSVHTQATKLAELAERREAEATSAAELSSQRLAIIAEAAAVLVKESAPEGPPSTREGPAELVAVAGLEGGVAPAAAPAADPAIDPDGLPEAVATAQRALVAMGVRKRGRPRMTNEEKAEESQSAGAGEAFTP